jgi:cytochrome c oxidase cbb3-type subunit 3
MIAALLTLGCEAEHRSIGPDRPLSAPVGASDQRIGFYDKNAWQTSNGGRLFTWYGCGDCHAANARNGLDLQGGRPVGFETTYHVIADGAPGMPAYADRMPTGSLWQVTAYVRSLRKLLKTKRVRSDLDQKGEPAGKSWRGPVQ